MCNHLFHSHSVLMTPKTVCRLCLYCSSPALLLILLSVCLAIDLTTTSQSSTTFYRNSAWDMTVPLGVWYLLVMRTIVLSKQWPSQGSKISHTPHFPTTVITQNAAESRLSPTITGQMQHFTFFLNECLRGIKVQDNKILHVTFAFQVNATNKGKMWGKWLFWTIAPGVLLPA